METTRVLIAVCCVLFTSMAANGPITVGETRIINDYPETVTFEIKAASADATRADMASEKVYDTIGKMAAQLDKKIGAKAQRQQRPPPRKPRDPPRSSSPKRNRVHKRSKV